MFKKIYKQDTS